MIGDKKNVEEWIEKKMRFGIECEDVQTIGKEKRLTTAKCMKSEDKEKQWKIKIS